MISRRGHINSKGFGSSDSSGGLCARKGGFSKPEEIRFKFEFQLQCTLVLVTCTSGGV